MKVETGLDIGFSHTKKAEFSEFSCKLFPECRFFLALSHITGDADNKVVRLVGVGSTCILLRVIKHI